LRVEIGDEQGSKHGHEGEPERMAVVVRAVAMVRRGDVKNWRSHSGVSI
jgi:hypothetical protein